jgi:hypothetical protein
MALGGAPPHARWKSFDIAACTIGMIADILRHLLTNDPADRYATTAWPPLALRRRPEMHLLTTSSVESDLRFLRGSSAPRPFQASARLLLSGPMLARVA